MNPDYQLGDLADDVLLANLKRCVGRQNQLTASMLAHLAEVDARGAFRQAACSTLLSYCVYELRLSEDEGQRRCRAARVGRQFPVLFAMLADASIHLTGILLLAPYLTAANHAELLARARYRSKREIERLVAEVAPRADVPSVVEPLGLAQDGAIRTAPSDWSSHARGLAGFVRALVPGDGKGQAPHASGAAIEVAAEDDEPGSERDGGGVNDVNGEGVRNGDNADAAIGLPTLEHGFASGPQSDAAVEPQGSMRYKVQFTADQAYVDLLEHARDLLQHQVPDRDLATVQRQALEALVDKLTRRRFGGASSAAAARRRASAPSGVADAEPTAEAVAVAAAEAAAPKEAEAALVLADKDASVALAATGASTVAEASAVAGAAAAKAAAKAGTVLATCMVETRERAAATLPTPRAVVAVSPKEATGRRRDAAGAPSTTERQAVVEALAMTEALAAVSTSTSAGSSRGDAGSSGAVSSSAEVRRRYIPVATRRSVWQRDGGRCTYVDVRGVRCRETARLEVHHERPHALGGPCTEDNLALRCTAHNGLAAEQDFGREHMDSMRQRGSGTCRDGSVKRADGVSPRRRGGGQCEVDPWEGSTSADGADLGWVVERPSEREIAEQQLRFVGISWPHGPGV